MDDDAKIRTILDENPKYIGLSYRLSTDKAIVELEKFIYKLVQYGLFENKDRRICFAGLFPTLRAIKSLGLDEKYCLVLMGSDKDIEKKTIETIKFLGIDSEELQNSILKTIIKESQPVKLIFSIRSQRE